MKILIVNYEYPPIGGGGGVATKDIAEVLAQHHEVHVLTSHFENGKIEHSVVEGVHVHRVFVLGRKDRATATFFSMMMFIPSAFIEGVLLCMKYKFDVMNAQFVLPSGIPAVFLKMIFGMPFVLSFIGGDVFDPTKGTSPHRHGFFRKMIHFISERADICTAISHDTKHRAQTLHHVSKEIIVTPIGFVPSSVSASERSQFHLPNDKQIAITVGRLIPRKGYKLLLDAWKDIPDAVLVVVGDGPLRTSLEEYAAKLGIKDRVRFVGYVSEKEKFQLLSLSDIYVSAAEHEGFGIVFLEAMAAGLPIVATNNGGHTDFLIPDKNALLVPPHDQMQLTKALKRLLEDSELRDKMKQHNKEDVQLYTREETTKKFEEVLKRVTTV